MRQREVSFQVVNSGLTLVPTIVLSMVTGINRPGAPPSALVHSSLPDVRGTSLLKAHLKTLFHRGEA